MASIPTADELGLGTQKATPQAKAIPKISMRQDMAAVDQSAAEKGAKEYGERVANEELAKAEVQFQIGTMAEASKLKDDQDLDTQEERHAAGMEDQLGKASANISSAKTRALFIERGKEGVAKANQAQSKKTTDKKHDRERGYMANAIDLMVKGGMNLEYGDPSEAALGIRLSLDSMVERGVVSREDAESTMRKAQLDMAYGRLKGMDATQQLEILNSKDKKTKAWLKDVPPDVLRQLRDQAEAKEMDNVAQAYAFESRGNENALNDMYDQAEKEGWDDTLTQKTRLRILRLEQDDEVGRQKALEDYYEEGAASIYTGETTIEMLESTPQGIDMLKKLSEAQRRNLVVAQDNAVERQAGKGRKYSDLVVKNKLKKYMADGQIIEGRKYWSENYASLNDADFKYFNVATSPTKSTNASFKPIQSTRQVMDDYLDANPLDEAGESKLWDDLNDMAMGYFNDNAGKNPPKQLMQEWVEEMHANVVLKPDDKSFMWIDYGGEQMLARDLPDTERKKYFAITDVFKQAGFVSSVGNLKFNQWTEEERQDFRTIRSKFPDEDPKLFLEKFQYKVKLDRNKAAEKSARQKAQYQANLAASGPAPLATTGLETP